MNTNPANLDNLRLTPGFIKATADRPGNKWTVIPVASDFPCCAPDGTCAPAFDLDNPDDVFDAVTDEELSHTELQTIADLLYASKNGGPLVRLLSNNEFVESLHAQLGAS